MGSKDKALASADVGWKTRVVLVGGMVGAVLGLASAFFYLRASEQAHGPDEAPKTPDPREAVKVGVALLAIVRSIAGWAKR